MTTLYTHQMTSIYAQLLDLTLDEQSVTRREECSYSIKNIDNVDYLYRTISVNGANVSVSLGRYSEDRDVIIAPPREAGAADLVGMLVAAGAVKHSPQMSKMIAVLIELGIFTAGGILVGSNAMPFYSSMLGCYFDNRHIETTDVDVASERVPSSSLSILIKSTIKTPLEDSLALKGFDKVMSLSRKDPPTSFLKDRVKIDVLTPMIGREDATPIYIKGLKAYAEPLRFLNYLIEDPQPAVILHNGGGLVQVPDPARFAIHKLVTSQRRPASQKAKSMKDLMQAQAILEHLHEYSPYLLGGAIDAAGAMGEKFNKQLTSAAMLLREDVKNIIVTPNNGVIKPLKPF